MPEKPLLIFPVPSDVGRYKLTGGQPKPFTSPGKTQQVERLQPSIDLLENTLKAERLSLQSDVSGIEPEMVLVFETRGLVTDFFKAVRKIPELEWVGELEKDFEPDDFFHFSDREKQIRGKFFFVLTNYQALRKILRLWSNYRYSRHFDHGTTKWRDLFSLLHDVRPWGFKDRIIETGILDDFNFRLQNDEALVPFEIELWYRKTPAQRQLAVNKIQGLLEQFDGEIISQSIIEEIAYHGILAKAPIQVFNHLTENTDIEFFQTSDIMFLRPVGQCAIKLNEDNETTETESLELNGELAPPIIALLDGLPLQNHLLLANRITIDDPDNYAQNYLAAARSHSTGMASIIIHNDLNGTNEAIKSRLYIRPIMKVQQTFRGNVELIPEDVLIIDLLHRAVRRMFEPENDTDPAAPTIKVINLSVGDPFRVLDNTMSSWAKLIDWLSFKYNVLFIISAGNYNEDLNYSSFVPPFQDLLGDVGNLKSETLKVIYNNNRLRKIISPAESINALTVGASDSDGLDYNSPIDRVLLFDSETTLSPLSRMGLGYKRSIKPDLLVPGGRALYRQRAGQKMLSWVESYLQPGIKVAAPSANGSLNGSVFTNGTSNSAAGLTHLAAKLHENLIENDLNEFLTNQGFSLVAKSLLAHCASWDSHSAEQIRNSIPIGNGNYKDLITRFLGYGNIHPERVFECTDKRVTLIGYGALSADNAHQFDLPIPAAISGSALWRSLTVTLAWFTPVNALNQTYRQAKLWFDFPNKAHENILSISRKFYDNDTVNRGTLQHEIFDGTQASAFIEGAVLPIRVNCKEDAPGLLKGQRINYVVSVTLEVDPNLQTDIYNDIRLKIRPRVPVR